MIDWQAVQLSFRLATWTSMILLFLGVPLSYGLSRWSWRYKFIIEAWIALPLVLPPTVLGFYLLIALGPQSPIGSVYQRLTGKGIPFTFEGLLIGSVIYSLPFAVQPFLAAFSAVDNQYLETSWSLGVSRFETFCRIVFPLSFRGIMTGLVLSFAHTLGEFGLVMMIGGNIPGTTRTVSVSIYDHVQALDYSSAGKTSFLLLLMTWIVLVIVGILKDRSIQTC
jgi:molybdate transport system permease protein